MKKAFKSFSFRSSFPGIFVMIGLILLYINQGASSALSKLVLATYYNFSLTNSFLEGLILGLINFVAITFFVDQAVQKRNILCKIIKLLSKFFLEKKPKEHDVLAHFTASICAIFYFATCIVAILFIPSGLNANLIIMTFGLGSVMSLFIWFQVFFHYYQPSQSKSVDRLKLEHATWLELTRQFIFIAAATGTGLIIYGVVNWVITVPQSISQLPSFQFTIFLLAAACIYIYVGFFLGVISPILIFIGKISERTEDLTQKLHVSSNN